MSAYQNQSDFDKKVAAAWEASDRQQKAEASHEAAVKARMEEIKAQEAAETRDRLNAEFQKSVEAEALKRLGNQ